MISCSKVEHIWRWRDEKVETAKLNSGRGSLKKRVSGQDGADLVDLSCRRCRFRRHIHERSACGWSCGGKSRRQRTSSPSRRMVVGAEGRVSLDAGAAYPVASVAKDGFDGRSGDRRLLRHHHQQFLFRRLADLIPFELLLGPVYRKCDTVSFDRSCKPIVSYGDHAPRHRVKRAYVTKKPQDPRSNLAQVMKALQWGWTEGAALFSRRSEPTGNERNSVPNTNGP